MNRQPLVSGEYYHVYNRGVDKRDVFSNTTDINRFLRSMSIFNTKEPVGSLYANSFREDEKIEKASKHKLVEIICYCLNPNHYHLVLKQLVDGGVSEFMKRLNGGYTCYFNTKHNRSGALFQGRFKSKHVSDNSYLLHLSAYVSLNNRVHELNKTNSRLVRSSWNEYTGDSQHRRLCSTSMILDQFESRLQYAKFAKNALKLIKKRKRENKELKQLLLE